jgi:hypothetical protein
MVVHRLGGVYADADTQCRVPVEAWLPNHCKLVLSLENSMHFCQWAFAAVPRHPALSAVMDLVLERVLRPMYTPHYPNFVHATTGPAVFTQALKEHLAIEDVGNLEDLLQGERKAEFERRGICIIGHEEMQEVLINLYSSQKGELKSDKWKSWSEELKLKQSE